MSFTPTCMCEMLSKESKEVLIVSNALNVMYVKGVKSGVCGFYAILYNNTYVKSVLYSEEAALLTFWDLSNYKGDSRQDVQPIPNSSN